MTNLEHVIEGKWNKILVRHLRGHLLPIFLYILYIFLVTFNLNFSFNFSLPGFLYHWVSLFLSSTFLFYPPVITANIPYPFQGGTYFPLEPLEIKQTLPLLTCGHLSGWCWVFWVSTLVSWPRPLFWWRLLPEVDRCQSGGRLFSRYTTRRRPPPVTPPPSSPPKIWVTFSGLHLSAWTSYCANLWWA
jgi:hypothetical protein